MPSYENYLSDASMSDSSDEEEDEEIDIYDPRDLDYWRLENIFDRRGPPPVIEYAASVGVVALRECVVLPLRANIETVVDVGSVNSWKTFWNDEPQAYSATFSHDDWDAIGEFCMQLCECCIEYPTRTEIRSCIIRLLALGKFVRPPLRSVLVRR